MVSTTQKAQTLAGGARLGNRAVVLVCACLWGVPAARAEQAGNEELEQALKVLRKADLKALKVDEKDAFVQRVEKAWQTVLGSGPAGPARLKQELHALAAAHEKDDFFLLGASALLWRSRQLEEAEEIARAWRTADLTANYNYVFLTALAAARTRDPRALPMLRALLREKGGTFYVVAHALDIVWPLDQRILWGIYGSGALPELEKVLAESRDATELETVLLLLAEDQDLAALPAARKLAAHEDAAVRTAALEALGAFGHPEDFEGLMRALKGAQPQEVEGVVLALCAYGDLRAAPALPPLFLFLRQSR